MERVLRNSRWCRNQRLEPGTARECGPGTPSRRRSNWNGTVWVSPDRAMNRHRRLQPRRCWRSSSESSRTLGGRDLGSRSDRGATPSPTEFPHAGARKSHRHACACRGHVRTEKSGGSPDIGREIKTRTPPGLSSSSAARSRPWRAGRWPARSRHRVHWHWPSRHERRSARAPGGWARRPVPDSPGSGS